MILLGVTRDKFCDRCDKQCNIAQCTVQQIRLTQIEVEFDSGGVSASHPFSEFALIVTVFVL